MHNVLFILNSSENLYLCGIILYLSEKDLPGIAIDLTQSNITI